MKKKMSTSLFSLALAFAAMPVQAQINAADSVMSHAGGHRLSIGGYGEAAYSRNFYSDNVYRYSRASQYKKDPSHGRFDIPHAVIYLGYDFGKGWTMGSEIEFEHTGTGSSVEQEYEESGEWETETEKGGEVELEQFWLQKSFARWANIRAGHIVVPVGLLNAHHEPLNFFTVYRPQGEYTILPSTWHDTGISFWGHSGKFRYELQMLAGLDGFKFSRDGWINAGAGSPFEYKVANKYGFATRLDYYVTDGLRLGLSGYYGRSMHNTFPHDMEGDNYNTQGEKIGTKTYDNIKGSVYIGSFDFTFNKYNWIVRGQADYGYLSDARTLSTVKINRTSNNAPYDKSYVGKNAVAIGVEVGYDIFSQIQKLHADQQKFYLFGRYDYYNSYIPANGEPTYDYTKKQAVTFGFNYYPIKQIAVKADYSYRFLKSQYNNEPSLNIGIAYEAFFL